VTTLHSWLSAAVRPQVPFERVPDLVAGRRVLLRGGWAYVSRHEARPHGASRLA
jgi:DNA primase large subunit